MKEQIKPYLLLAEPNSDLIELALTVHDSGYPADTTLRPYSFNFFAAQSIAEILAFSSHQRLIFGLATEHRLSDGTGLELIRGIKAQNKNPITLLNTSRTKYEVEPSYSGVVDYIRYKPNFTPVDLHDFFEQLFLVNF